MSGGGLAVRITNPEDIAGRGAAGPFAPVGAHTSNSSLATAATLTPPAGATQLVLQAQAQNVRYTLDGTTPTASVGFQLFAGDTATIQVGAGMAIKVIQETSGAAIAFQWGA